MRLGCASVVGNSCCAPLATVHELLLAHVNAVPMLLSQYNATPLPSPPVVLQSPKCQTIEPDVSTVTSARPLIWVCACADTAKAKLDSTNRTLDVRRSPPGGHRTPRFALAYVRY